MSATDAPTGQITQLLQRHHAGDRQAFDRMVPLVYERLRGIARRQLARDRRGPLLDTTSLVQEAYLQLVEEDGVDWRARPFLRDLRAGDAADHHRRRPSPSGGQARRQLGAGEPEPGPDRRRRQPRPAAGAGRGADPPGRVRPTHGPSGGMPLFRRDDRSRNRRGAVGPPAHRAARMDPGADLAAAVASPRPSPVATAHRERIDSPGPIHSRASFTRTQPPECAPPSTRFCRSFSPREKVACRAG